MYESISKNNELENEMTLDMSYFWYSDDSNGHLHAPQASSPTIPAYKLDQNSNTQPPRVHIQSMDGSELPLTWR